MHGAVSAGAAPILTPVGKKPRRAGANLDVCPTAELERVEPRGGASLPALEPVRTSPPAARDSRDWVRALSGSGPEYHDAVEDLHALLLRAARFEVSRRRASLSHVRGEELE